MGQIVHEGGGQDWAAAFSCPWEAPCAGPENVVVALWEKAFLFTVDHCEFFSLWLIKNNLFYKPNSTQITLLC